MSLVSRTLIAISATVGALRHRQGGAYDYMSRAGDKLNNVIDAIDPYIISVSTGSTAAGFVGHALGAVAGAAYLHANTRSPADTKYANLVANHSIPVALMKREDQVATLIANLDESERYLNYLVATKAPFAQKEAIRDIIERSAKLLRMVQAAQKRDLPTEPTTTRDLALEFAATNSP